MPGGTRAPVVLDEEVYWYVSGERRLLRAPADSAGEPQRVSCSGPLTGPLASDGTRLYAIGGYITADGETTAVYSFRPSTGEWTLLHELPDRAEAIAAYGGRVAVLTNKARPFHAEYGNFERLLWKGVSRNWARSGSQAAGTVRTQ